MLMLPKAFANETLDTVACYRGLNVFTRNCQTQSGEIVRAILPEYDKIFIRRAGAGGKHALELAAAGQTLVTGETPAMG